MSVKPKRRGRPPTECNKLTSASIVEGAKEWMLAENRKLSIRGLANHLDVDPMAIYHYFANKAELLEAITVSIMHDIYMPKGSGRWQSELQELCRSYLSLLRNHPGLLETLLSMDVSMLGAANVFSERFDLATASLQLKGDRRQAALDLLVDYLHGFAFALHCSSGKKALDISAINKPLALYFQALGRKD